ncbi:MAG TPA: hypothetical protein VK101_00460 [Limnochordia bacterium]|nr:hypothetical protein [Limnochordia bacterium]
MHVLDYAGFRDALVDAITSKGLQVSVDEAVFLGTNSRGCELLIHHDDEPGEVWGKVSFEWVAANQALFEEIHEQGDVYDPDMPLDPDAEVMMNAAFHLHFGTLSISTEAMSGVAAEIKRHAEAFFGDDGGVVAEVSMTSADARLECLRFEINTSAPMISEEPWWEQLADVCAAMLDKLEEIHGRLRSEFGSPRGAAE